MLIEFNIENFRSIKDKVTFSLLATKDKSLNNNLINVESLKEDSLLKTAVIYGANASGKTNVLLALRVFRLLVINSHKHQQGDKLPYSPFKLDKKLASKPTKFEATFIKDSIKYVYNLSYNSARIVSENLYYFPNNKKSIIFERKDKFRFTIDEKKQNFIASRTLPNVLYLSKATNENYKKTLPTFEWFKGALKFIGAYHPGPAEEYTISLLSDDKMKSLILKALSVADLGIDDIKAESKDLDDFPVGFPPEIKKFIKKQKGNLKHNEIQTFHKDIPFDFYTEESEGTKRIFSLIGPCIDALQNGKILVLDELDTKLHHLLNIFIINLFNDPTQNKANGQLIFKTNNTNLLDLDLFRRDQIWFTEKNHDFGSTDLYSLVEYSPRKDKDIQKGYLAGKYGALPFIKENKIF